MNNTENDDYWNESKVSTFNFEKDDNKVTESLSYEDVSNAIPRKENESVELFEHMYSTQHIGITTARNYLSEYCIEWILQNEPNHINMNTLVSSNLGVDEEIRLLRRQVKERWISPHIEDTISRIFYEQPHAFELYKSLNDKKKLLNCAIESADGDAVLAVIVFLARTVKKNLFRQLIMDAPVAISHYVHYLYIRRQMSDLNDILEALGKSKEAMMKQLTVACNNTNKIQQRLTLLLKNYSFDTWERQVIENYLKLVEWQTVVSKQIKDSDIVGKSASEFIKYCYSHKLSPNILNIPQMELQPEYLAKHLHLSNKQLSVVKIYVNSEEKKWDIVRNLLIAKSWVGNIRLNVDLPVHKLLDQLQKCDAPMTLIDDVLSCITNMDRRKEIARSLENHSVVIEAYNKKKEQAK